MVEFGKDLHARQSVGRALTAQDLVTYCPFCRSRRIVLFGGGVQCLRCQREFTIDFFRNQQNSMIVD